MPLPFAGKTSQIQVPPFPQRGKAAFARFLSAEPMERAAGSRLIRFFGHWTKGRLTGVGSLRGRESSLPFVCGEGEPGKGHRRHFAERNGMLCTKAGTAALTVNAFLAGIAFYERQGFWPPSEERQADGLRFTPMELSLKGEPSCLPSDR